MPDTHWNTKSPDAEPHDGNSGAARPPRMVGARQARDRGLKWVRTIRAEAVQHPSREFWAVNELIEYDNGDQGWRYASERPLFGGPRAIRRFETKERAEAGARSVMAELERAAEAQRERAAREHSDRIRRAKESESARRLADEERLMLEAAIQRHRTTPRVPEGDIVAIGGPAGHLPEILAATRAMPYLRRVFCQKAYPKRVYRSEDGVTWDVDHSAIGGWGDVTLRAAEFARRATIADGFGLDAEANWAETKAAIRRILKPRANELLERASVRRMLDEALAAGRTCLVWGRFVFWYERSELAWVVKEVDGDGVAADERRGDTLWLEGTILSTNHGRIIVLPYRREDGTTVRGHTKNSRADGPAKPRHPSQYVEIPFERLDGDLMVGLHGELPYE